MKGLGVGMWTAIPGNRREVLEREMGKEARPVQGYVLTSVTPLETKTQACQDSRGQCRIHPNFFFSAWGKNKGCMDPPVSPLVVEFAP